jgi:pilus assembly protein Flp/PilA
LRYNKEKESVFNKAFRRLSDKGVTLITCAGEDSMKHLILAYLKDEEGQTSTEYILLIAVVALIVFKFKSVATERLTNIVNSVFDKAGNMVDGIDAQ